MGNRMSIRAFAVLTLSVLFAPAIFFENDFALRRLQSTCAPRLFCGIPGGQGL